MAQSIKSVSVFIFIVLSTISLTANDHSESEHGSAEHEPSIVENVLHHISDAHEWHFFDFNGHPVSIPLPIILYTDGHLDIFMSSAFEHGKSSKKIGDREYAIDHHGNITEASGLEFLDFSITKNVASMLISLVILVLILRKVAKSYNRNNGVPRGIQAFIEPIILFIKDDVAKPNLGHSYQKYLPYLLTLFFFILVNNLLGLLPGAANVTGNIAITIVLSFITLMVTNISGKKAYWSHIFKPPGVPLALMPIMIPIEMVGILTKPFALMIRLFANITAGHIVILSLISLIFMAQSGLGTGGAFGVAPVSVAFVLFMYLIELLVAFLQAYIFTLLTSLFIGLAIVEDH